MNKSNMSDVVDRLSKLPDSLIFHIYWLMPMRDVVKTTVLSKRWQNLWTTSPFLNFKFCIKYKVTDNVRNFVNRSLIAWKGKGVKILKFRVAFDFRVKKSLYSDIDLWLRFAMENGVEELYVEFLYEDHILGEYVDVSTRATVEAYTMPQFLYSCTSLKVLSLKYCNIHQTNECVLWNHLKVLDIHCYRNLYQRSIDHIFSGSPQLEEFTFTFFETYANLSIRSSSLKTLSIQKYLPTGYELCIEETMYTELTIWSPNLESLNITGIPYSKYLLVEVPSLTRATLWMNCQSLFLGEDGFIVETLFHILPTIQYVESFTLAEWSLKVLGDMKKKGLVSPFPNVKFLQLIVGFEEYEQIVGLLEIFPKLTRLVLVVLDDAHVPLHQLAMIDTNRPKSFLLELRTVDVTWTEGDYIFPFIEVLLKYASKLERMVFRVKGKKMLPAPPLESLLFASQKLLRMKRSSPNAELICCEY